MIETICQSCGNLKSFEESYIGKTFKCPSCSNPVIIQNVGFHINKEPVSKNNSFAAEIEKAEQMKVLAKEGRSIYLSDEEIKFHEDKTLEFIKNNDVVGAKEYYYKNFGYINPTISTKNAVKEKIRNLAEKNGLGLIFKNHNKKEATRGAIFSWIFIIIIGLLFFKMCS